MKHSHMVQPMTAASPEHSAHHRPAGRKKTTAKENNFRLAFSATLHCLIGCGLGEVLGMVAGTWLHLSNKSTMWLAIVLGAVLGLLFGMRPLLRAGYSFRAAVRQTIFAEGLSIAVMESVEVLVQVYTPGVMDAHLSDSIFWFGMLGGLVAGFIAAFPVNYWFVKKGIRHRH